LIYPELGNGFNKHCKDTHFLSESGYKGLKKPDQAANLPSESENRVNRFSRTNPIKIIPCLSANSTAAVVTAALQAIAVIPAFIALLTMLAVPLAETHKRRPANDC
jgi:hypothetical protein